MSGMELVAAPIVSVAVEETARPLWASICSTIKNIVRGPQLDLLESNMNSLLALKNDAEEEIKSAKRDGKVIKDQATVWVCKVKERKRKYDQIHEEANSSGSFLSCITKRHRISTKVAELLGEIESLQKDGSSLAGSVARSYPEVKAVEHWPGPSIQDQTASVSEDLARVRTLLFDDNGFQRIGIWGMGGVGKTNLILIPERFLKGFEALRVLNISRTRIKSLPDSLLQLVDLRALLLKGCCYLEELPPLESLSRLQVLDLSWTRIRQLPRGLEQLSNLEHPHPFIQNAFSSSYLTNFIKI